MRQDANHRVKSLLAHRQPSLACVSGPWMSDFPFRLEDLPNPEDCIGQKSEPTMKYPSRIYTKKKTRCQ